MPRYTKYGDSRRFRTRPQPRTRLVIDDTAWERKLARADRNRRRDGRTPAE